MSGDLRIDVYKPEDSEAALALERRSAQGNRFRLRFDRPYFHRRAENFETWRLLTARVNGSLVGVIGGAIKTASFRGKRVKALYFFDVRVAPEARRSGVAQRLLGELTNWGNADIGYGYAVADNEASIRLCREWMGSGISPACCYLAYPTYKSNRKFPTAQRADPQAVHASFLDAEGPFDLYSNPVPAFSSEGYIGSWVLENGRSRAACSAWSNEQIFAEVVERVPRPMAAVGTLLRTWPISLLPAPKIPRPGERLRSWYIFDFHASDDLVAARLMESVGAQARSLGIDFCYIIHREGRSWAQAMRRRFPRLVAPVIPYAIIAGTLDLDPLFFERPYIDIRDV